jgi:hypothetical protein
MAIVRANQAAHVQQYTSLSPILGVSFGYSLRISHFAFRTCLTCPLSRFGQPVAASSSTRLSRGDPSMPSRPLHLNSGTRSSVARWNKFSP